MFKQIRDILPVIQSFYDELDSYYNRMSEKVKKDKVQILLDSVKKNRDSFKQTIDQLRKTGGDDILNVWIRHTPDSKSKIDFDEINLSDDMSADDVVKAVIEFEAWLDNLFGYITETSKSTSVQTVFSRLHENLKMSKLNMVKDSNLLEDM
jgi:hypothetical protein